MSGIISHVTESSVVENINCLQYYCKHYIATASTFYIPRSKTMLFGLVSTQASKTIFDHRCYTYQIDNRYYSKRKAPD